MVLSSLENNIKNQLKDKWKEMSVSNFVWVCVSIWVGVEGGSLAQIVFYLLEREKRLFCPGLVVELWTGLFPFLGLKYHKGKI